ncbi:MAG: glycosyltransferase [Phycisphaeraceae bacterium]
MLRQIGATAVISMLTTSNLATLAATFGYRSMRVIVSERNDTTIEPLPRLLQVARRRLYGRADVVTANVQRSLDDMRRYVASDRLRFVPNSVETPDWKVDAAAAKRVLFVGRMVEQKDPVAAVNGFARACGTSSAGQTDGWQLVMVGEGPLLDEVRAEVDRWSIGDQVMLTGYLNDVAEQLRHASIFVMTSRFEGTPNALLEAMAAGHASVVSDALPGALHYVDDEVSGLVYRHGDTDHLAHQLRRLMDDAQLRGRLGDEARHRMGELAPEIVAATWMSLLVSEAPR